jgi:hypothetical protein
MTCFFMRFLSLSGFADAIEMDQVTSRKLGTQPKQQNSSNDEKKQQNSSNPNHT